MNTVKETIPTLKLNLLLIRYQWRPYTLHFIFCLRSSAFSSRGAPKPRDRS